jgi:pyrroloquinoline-quinone synthase
MIVARLDAAASRYPLLDHTFYRAWASGTLTLDDLAFYSAQYWRQVQAFPGHLESLAQRVHGEAKSILLKNLADERDGDHPGLWVRFAEELGVSADDLRASTIELETTACVQAFADAAKNASAPFALGMLYGYESQTPAVATTKVTGLREHYGIDGPAIEYFKLHGELDVEHSSDLARAVDEVDLEEAEAGAEAGARAIWGLLDGVARARDIAC